jgi:hypothetical protein
MDSYRCRGRCRSQSPRAGQSACLTLSIGHFGFKLEKVCEVLRLGAVIPFQNPGGTQSPTLGRGGEPNLPEQIRFRIKLRTQLGLLQQFTAVHALPIERFRSSPATRAHEFCRLMQMCRLLMPALIESWRSGAVPERPFQRF